MGKKEPKQVKVELRVDREWVSRVEAEAKELGLSRSAYIRMVVLMEMNLPASERLIRKNSRS